MEIRIADQEPSRLPTKRSALIAFSALGILPGTGNCGPPLDFSKSVTGLPAWLHMSDIMIVLTGIMNVLAGFNVGAGSGGGFAGVLGAAAAFGFAFAALLPKCTAKFHAWGWLVALAIAGAEFAIGYAIGRSHNNSDQSLGTGDVATMPGTGASPTTPTSWLNGLPSSSVIFLTSGLALMSLGINLSATAPTYQFINVPTVALPQLQNALQTASGQTLPPNPTGDVFVLKGNGTPGDPDRAVIVSPGQGGGDSVQVVTLDPNGNIVGPLPPNTYIPFYQSSAASAAGNSPIAAATTALYDQNAGLNLAQSSALGVGSRFAAMKYAGMSDKILSPADSGPVDAIPVSATGQ